MVDRLQGAEVWRDVSVAASSLSLPGLVRFAEAIAASTARRRLILPPLDQLILTGAPEDRSVRNSLTLRR